MKRCKLILLVGCSLLAFFANGQTVVPFGFWVDSTSAMTAEAVVAGASFGPMPAGPIKARAEWPTVWLRFTLHNPQPDTLRRLFFGGYHVDWSLTEQTGPGNRLQTRRSGWLVQPGPDPGPDAFTLPVTVAPGQSRTFWFRTTGYIIYSNITPRLYTHTGYIVFEQQRTMARQSHFGFYCLLMGICLFLSVFSLIQAFYVGDLPYGFWAIYLAATFGFLLLMADLAFNLKWVAPPVAALALPAQYIIAIGYVLFLRSFLDLKQYMPGFIRLTNWVLGVLAVFFLLCYWSSFYLVGAVLKMTDQAVLFVELILMGIMVAVGWAGVPNRGLFLTGSLGLIVLAGIGTFINEFGPASFDHFWTDPIVWFGLGVVFELLFFNLALSQRSHRTVREMQQLEHEKQFDVQRIQLLTDQFQRRIAQTEMAALRAQMNPHFIFNCLNSIQFYTAQNDVVRASDYLTKFSRLIRLVLENSRSERVTLANELDTLRLYIDMEAMRFQEKVSYLISVTAAVDVEATQLPPLLIQPYVENAIWHGLMHKEAGGQVRIDVCQPRAGLLRVVITDNGVGRTKAAEYKSKSATSNKSFGLKLTAERIELINQLYQSQTQVYVDDLTDRQGQASGTRVTVEIPV